VAGLAAVRPDWRGIVHLDGVRRERGGVGTGRHANRIVRRERHVGCMKEERKRTYNPESKPTWPLVELEESIWQGLAKLDCVTVWFFWWNSKVMVSPGCAVTFEGSKVRVVPPTMIL
jgi:hypothetical protein